VQETSVQLKNKVKLFEEDPANDYADRNKYDRQKNKLQPYFMIKVNSIIILKKSKVLFI
jgi:hypothetical protein